VIDGFTPPSRYDTPRVGLRSERSRKFLAAMSSWRALAYATDCFGTCSLFFVPVGFRHVRNAPLALTESGMQFSRTSLFRRRFIGPPPLQITGTRHRQQRAHPADRVVVAVQCRGSACFVLRGCNASGLREEQEPAARLQAIRLVEHKA